MSDATAKQELEWAHAVLDELGVPREKRIAQARGDVVFTLAGRIDQLSQRTDKWEAIARQLGAALELSDPAHMGVRRELRRLERLTGEDDAEERYGAAQALAWVLGDYMAPSRAFGRAAIKEDES